MTRIGKNERVVEIPWERVTLQEAVDLMANHDGNCWIDGDRETVVMVE